MKKNKFFIVVETANRHRIINKLTYNKATYVCLDDESTFDFNPTKSKIFLCTSWKSSELRRWLENTKGVQYTAFFVCTSEKYAEYV